MLQGYVGVFLETNPTGVPPKPCRFHDRFGSLSLHEDAHARVAIGEICGCSIRIHLKKMVGKGWVGWEVGNQIVKCVRKSV